jgi:TM2 domain-containing membrane protein YozV
MDDASGRGGAIRRLGAAGTYAVAYLLWFFLGPMGAHRFYLGKRTSGRLYLCTFGVFGLGWIADSVLTAFMARDAIRAARLGAESTDAPEESEARAESEGGEEAGAGRDSAGELVDAGLSSVIIVLAALALLVVLVYFDYALLALPLGASWLALILGKRASRALSASFFPLSALPAGAEDAAAYGGFQGKKAYRIPAAKYLAYPLYALAYPFLARKLDRRRAEVRELSLFFALHSGSLLLWLIIAVSRLYSEAFSLGKDAWLSLLALHPAGFALGLSRGWYASLRMIPFLLSSAAFIALAGYFAQLVSALSARAGAEKRWETRSGIGAGFARRAAALIASLAFVLIGLSAALSPAFREGLSSLSGARFDSAVDYAYREESLRALVERHIVAPENDSLVYDALDASIQLAGEKGRDFARSERWTALRGAYGKAFASDAARFADARYRGYYRFYPIVFSDRSSARHCYLVYALDDMGVSGAALLPAKRRIYPLMILEASAPPLTEKGEPSLGAIELRARFPDGFTLAEGKGGTDGGGAGGKAGGSAELSSSKRLEADIGDKLFLEELSEGFRRYFIDQGMSAKAFEIRTERFLARERKR